MAGLYRPLEGEIMSEKEKWRLEPCDGRHCAQVLVYDEEDLEYWKEECRRTGHLMMKSAHAPENAMGYLDPAHDIYQIYPPAKAEIVEKMYGGQEIDLTK